MRHAATSWATHVTVNWVAEDRCMGVAGTQQTADRLPRTVSQFERSPQLGLVSAHMSSTYMATAGGSAAHCQHTADSANSTIFGSPIHARQTIAGYNSIHNTIYTSTPLLLCHGPNSILSATEKKQQQGRSILSLFCFWSFRGFFNPLICFPIMTMTQEVECAACFRPIRDRFLLKVLDKPWHPACVRCELCRKLLDEKCFYKEGKMYCKDDFYR